jgi:hypothetical protein
MTETRKPPRCHYDRALHQRVTRAPRRLPPRTGTGDCPAAGRGCAPCTAPHCLICGREHATLDQPDTCPECIGKIRDDLAELGRDYADLATEAIAGGGDGRLVAAAPIPGGTAAGPPRPDGPLRPAPHLPRLRADPDGRGPPGKDPIPTARRARPVGGHLPRLVRPRPAPRATVAGAIRYLSEQLDHMANGQDGPRRPRLARVHPPDPQPPRRPRAGPPRRAGARAWRRVLRVRRPAGPPVPRPEAVPPQDPGPGRAAAPRCSGSERAGLAPHVGTYPELGSMEQDLAPPAAPPRRWSPRPAGRARSARTGRAASTTRAPAGRGSARAAGRSTTSASTSPR